MDMYLRLILHSTKGDLLAESHSTLNGWKVHSTTVLERGAL